MSGDNDTGLRLGAVPEFDTASESNSSSISSYHSAECSSTDSSAVTDSSASYYLAPSEPEQISTSPDLQVDTFQRLVSMPIPDDGMAPNTTLDHDGVAPSEKLFHNIIGSSFQFGVAVPRPFIAGQISPLTKEILEIPDEYLSLYNDVRSEMIDTCDTESEAVKHLSTAQLAQFFSTAIDVKNALVLRRAAVLADLGRCVEYMAFLLSLYDHDSGTIRGVVSTIEGIEEEAQRGNHNLDFVGLEHGRAWQGDRRDTSSFMETNGIIYESIVASGKHNGAMDYALQFIQDPYSLREHRIRPYHLLPRPKQQ